MVDKVFIDLENERKKIEKRAALPFYTFLYDHMVMKYGLQSIAIKLIIQMSNGLNITKEPFAHLITRMLGLALPQLKLDEVQIVLRSHLFFKMVQYDWSTRMKARHEDIEITSEMIGNLKNGGECNIFDLIDEIPKAFKKSKEISEELILNLKPDCLFKKSDDRNDLVLKFLVLKITNKFAKIGRDIKHIFETFDQTKCGYCKSFNPITL